MSAAFLIAACSENSGPTSAGEESASTVYNEILAAVRKKRISGRQLSPKEYVSDLQGTENVSLAYSDFGACPFECCVYGEWVAEENTPVLQERHEGSPVVFWVLQDEKVTAETGVVVTRKLGVGRPYSGFDEDGAPVYIGSEKLELLHYEGEGFWAVRRGDEIISLDLMPIETPETTWWVKVKNSRGQTGWSNLPDAYRNKDACG